MAVTVRGEGAGELCFALAFSLWPLDEEQARTCAFPLDQQRFICPDGLSYRACSAHQT